MARHMVVVAAAATVLAVGLVAIAVQSPEAGSRAARLLSAAHKDTMEYVYMPAAAAKDANARSPSLRPSLSLLNASCFYVDYRWWRRWRWRRGACGYCQTPEGCRCTT